MKAYYSYIALVGLCLPFLILGTGCVAMNQKMVNVPQRVVAPTGILTEKDFEVSGLVPALTGGTMEHAFRVLIHPEMPAYTLRVVSFNMQTGEGGYIAVLRGDEDPRELVQMIQLDPNHFLSDQVAAFFTVHDINFDGFLDIGVPFDGGAKWRAYRYWIFDQRTGTFVSAPVTEDLEKIAFNFISFDAQKQQITTDNLSGAGRRTLYQFQDGRISILKNEQLDTVARQDQKVSTDHSIMECMIETTTYPMGKPHVVQKEFAGVCRREMHTIPFEYPEEYRERYL